jgi:membrane-bound metal-dependent hydrolase YbcI (DUF457 family)
MAGYVISKFATWNSPREGKAWKRQLSPVLIIAVLASLLPDIDAIAGLLAKDLGRYHNNGTHSLVVGLGVALLAGLIALFLDRRRYLNWFFIVLAGYELHVLMDFFTYDSRGVMFFWPLSSERFASDLILFYGVRWSYGWFAVEHLVTLATELVFVVGIYGLTLGVEKFRLRGGYNVD